MGDPGKSDDIELIKSIKTMKPDLDKLRGFYKIHGVYQSFVPMIYNGKVPRIDHRVPEELVDALKEFSLHTKVIGLMKDDKRVPINAPGPLDCTLDISFEKFDELKTKFSKLLSEMEDLVPMPLDGVMYDKDCLFFPIMTVRDELRCVTLVPLIVRSDGIQDGQEVDVDTNLLQRTINIVNLLNNYGELKDESTQNAGLKKEDFDKLLEKLNESDDTIQNLANSLKEAQSSKNESDVNMGVMKLQIQDLEKKLADAASSTAAPSGTAAPASPQPQVTKETKEKLESTAKKMRQESEEAAEKTKQKILRIIQNYGELYRAMSKIVAQYDGLRKFTLDSSNRMHDQVQKEYEAYDLSNVKARGKDDAELNASDYFNVIQNGDISNAGFKSLKLPKWDEDTGDELEEENGDDGEGKENEEDQEDEDNETEGLGAFLYEKGIRLGKPTVGAKANKLLTASSIALKRLCPDIAANAVPASPSDDVDASIFVPDKALASDGKTLISFSEAHKDEYSTSYTLLNARFEDKSRDLTKFQKLVNKVPDNEAINAEVIDKLEGYFGDLQDESRKAFNIASKDSGFTDILNKANLDIMFDQCHRHVNEVFYALATAKFGVRFLDMEGPLKASRHTKLKNLGEIISSIKQSIAAFAKGGNFASNPKAAHAWFMLSFGMTMEKKSKPQALKYENGTPLNFQPSMAPLPLAEMLHSGFWLCFFWFDLVIPKSGGDKSKAMAINAIFAKNSRLVDGTPPPSSGSSDDMDTSGPAVYDDDGNLREFSLGRFKSIEDELFDYNLKRSPKGEHDLNVKMGDHEAEFFLDDTKILRITSTHAKDIHKLVHEGMHVEEIFISDNGVVLADNKGKMHIFDIGV